MTLADGRHVFQSLLFYYDTVLNRCQLTCAACSVNDSLIFTITFSFASSFAAMSMLATHCQFHEDINRLAAIIRRSSTLACTFIPAHPSFRLEMLHTLGAQGASSAVHDDTVGSHVSALASCEQRLKWVPASVEEIGGTDGRGREGGVTPVAQQVGEINAAFTNYRKYHKHH